MSNNPYYTQQEMRQQEPYVNNQPPSNLNSNHQLGHINNQQPGHVNYQQPPYFNNQQPLSPQYPPYHRQQPSANIMIVEVPSNHPPANLTRCNFCRQLTPTYMQLRSGVFVWLMCLIIMMLTCCCWWIAFWVDSWKDKIFRCHRCGNVKAVQQGGC